MPDGSLSIFRTVFAILLVYWILNKLLTRGKYAHYPPTAKGPYIPWLGHILAFGNDPVSFLRKQASEVGEAVSFTLFGRDCVLLISNDGQRAFYEAPEEVLNTAKTYKFTVPCFGPGVVYDAPDEKFQQHRGMAGKALTVERFRIYVPKIEEEVNNFIETAFPGDEGTIDFSKAINELTVLTSTACLQGPEIRAQVHTGYSELIAALDHALSAVGFFYPWLPLPTYRARDIARRKLGTMFNTILKNRRESGYRGEDMMQTLMDARYDDGTPLTDDEIVGNLIALMLAGQHTSNITTSWLMINLLTRPAVLEKVMKEQEEVLGDSEKLDYEKVSKMKYLHDCIRETLRMTPPIIVIWRTAMQDFKFKNYVIPKGTLVTVAPSAYSRSRFSVYSNPDEFDPERFERREHMKAEYSYFPFSAGRHACIGERFAYLQIKSIVSILLRKFEFELVGTREDYPADYTSLMAGPRGPIKIKYRRRAAATA